jgi:hypothetical protein
MAGRPAALEDENSSHRPIEESMGCKMFSEQPLMAGRPAARENENELDLGWVKMEGAEASEHSV